MLHVAWATLLVVTGSICRRRPCADQNAARAAAVPAAGLHAAIPVSVPRAALPVSVSGPALPAAVPVPRAALPAADSGAAVSAGLAAAALPGPAGTPAAVRTSDRNVAVPLRSIRLFTVGLAVALAFGFRAVRRPVQAE